jgi:hypothetical protein
MDTRDGSEQGSSEMAESIFKANAGQMETSERDVHASNVQEAVTKPQELAMELVLASSEPVPQIIWTPRFIILFVLTLVLGLSAESLLVQARDNGSLAENGVLLVHVALISLCWIAIIIRVRSPWPRLGAVFGCIWAVFLSIFLAITLNRISPNVPVLPLLNSAFSIALLGCYICLSIDRTAVSRWDTWFFSIAPIVAAGSVIAVFFLAPPDSRSFGTIEVGIIATANVLSLLVWWLRPSCWKTQPGTTFLFGTASLILLLLAIPGLNDNDANFFFRQVMLLCILLGGIRTLQGELRYEPLTMGKTS